VERPKDLAQMKRKLVAIIKEQPAFNSPRPTSREAGPLPGQSNKSPVARKSSASTPRIAESPPNS
jgi:hypothetical protein